ncbi:actin cortical patch SUR7/pH-response regulator pali [Favolaschia claudopus]|uniref:Actin cortical patch SUR7/pH-response regulator pali n=1 Tax=Favolaschia claudopus TaxID=2862362 RepID=A0AAW0CVX4_9AGAR
MSGAVHFGTFLLFVAMVLLLVASISAPTVSRIDMLHVPLTNGSSVHFGSWGYCIMKSPEGTSCTPAHVGYKIADELAALGVTPFKPSDAKNVNTITGGFILHPIAAGIVALAFLFSLCSHRFGFLFVTAIALVGFVVTLIAVIFDFVTFGSVRQQIRDNGGRAYWGSGVWIVLVAGIILLFASLATCFACITGRRRSREKFATAPPVAANNY